MSSQPQPKITRSTLFHTLQREITNIGKALMCPICQSTYNDVCSIVIYCCFMPVVVFICAYSTRCFIHLILLHHTYSLCCCLVFMRIVVIVLSKLSRIMKNVHVANARRKNVDLCKH